MHFSRRKIIRANGRAVLIGHVEYRAGQRGLVGTLLQDGQGEGISYLSGEFVPVENYHCHHIKPKSKGGTNDFDNLCVLIFIGLLLGKRSSFFHCVIKQFLDSPAYFAKTFTEVGHAAIVVVDSYYINVPVVECFKVRFFPNGPQKFSALPNDFVRLFLWKRRENPYDYGEKKHKPGVTIEMMTYLVNTSKYIKNSRLALCIETPPEPKMPPIQWNKSIFTA